jgi:hypothetical protein
MEPSPTWEATICAVIQEFSNILWNPKVHYRVQTALHRFPSSAKLTESILPCPIYRRYVLILSIHLHLGLPSSLLPYGFPAQILYAFLFSLIRATYPVHIILLEAKYLYFSKPVA